MDSERKENELNPPLTGASTAVLVVFQLERLLDERCQSAKFALSFLYFLSFFLLFFLPFYKAVRIHDVLILCKFAGQIYFANEDMKSFPTLPSYHLCTSIYKYAWTYTAVTWFFCGLTAVSRVTFCAVVHLIHCDRTVIIPCSAKTQILVVEILEVYFMSFTCHVASYIQNRSQASFLVGSSPSRAHLKCCSSLNTSSPG